MNNSPPNITMTRRQFLALTGGITSVSALASMGIGSGGWAENNVENE